MSREMNLKGAWRESVVAADLQSKGFEVFTALGTASCDLIAHKYGLCLRIEVKGPHHGVAPIAPLGCMSKARYCSDFDVFATVVDKDTIVYARSVLHIPNKASKELGMAEYSPHTTKRYIERARKLKEEHEQTSHHRDGSTKQD